MIVSDYILTGNNKWSILGESTTFLIHEGNHIIITRSIRGGDKDVGCQYENI